MKATELRVRRKIAGQHRRSDTGAGNSIQVQELDVDVVSGITGLGNA